jgi:MarR family transcriptional regulator, 2-MHQ and catechol-resistance regulon repressor
MDKRYLRSIRLLAECMQLFEKKSSARVRSLGFTESQFDIIATLGNTAGMTCKELGEKTLITKGTLTGVLDRLDKKGLIERTRGGEDRRQFFIKLTPAGERTFADIFPQVVRQGGHTFAEYTEQDFVELEHELLKLKNCLNKNSKLPD